VYGSFPVSYWCPVAHHPALCLIVVPEPLRVDPALAFLAIGDDLFKCGRVEGGFIPPSPILYFTLLYFTLLVIVNIFGIRPCLKNREG